MKYEIKISIAGKPYGILANDKSQHLMHQRLVHLMTLLR
jgi:hypothetical protein